MNICIQLCYIYLSLNWWYSFLANIDKQVWQRIFILNFELIFKIFKKVGNPGVKAKGGKNQPRYDVKGRLCRSNRFIKKSYGVLNNIKGQHLRLNKIHKRALEWGFVPFVEQEHDGYTHDLFRPLGSTKLYAHNSSFPVKLMSFSQPMGEELLICHL